MQWIKIEGFWENSILQFHNMVICDGLIHVVGEDWGLAPIRMVKGQYLISHWYRWSYVSNHEDEIVTKLVCQISIWCPLWWKSEGQYEELLGHYGVFFAIQYGFFVHAALMLTTLYYPAPCTLQACLPPQSLNLSPSRCLRANLIIVPSWLWTDDDGAGLEGGQFVQDGSMSLDSVSLSRDIGVARLEG